MHPFDRRHKYSDCCGDADTQDKIFWSNFHADLSTRYKNYCGVKPDVGVPRNRPVRLRGTEMLHKGAKHRRAVTRTYLLDQGIGTDS